MAGAIIEAKIEDAGLRRTLDAINARIADMTPLWAEIGEIVLASVLRNFRERRAPDGTPWEPASRRYAAWKSRRGYSASNILILKNRLMRSIHPQPARDSVTIGTNVIYAAIHQFGGTISRGGRTQVSAHKAGGGYMSRKEASRKKRGAVRISIAGIGPGSVRMPARPFLGVRGEDWPRITAAIERYVLKGA